MLLPNTSPRRTIDRRQQSTRFTFEQLECRTLLAGITNIGSYVIDNAGIANPSDTEQAAQVSSNDGRPTTVAPTKETANNYGEIADAIFMRDESWLPLADDAKFPSGEKVQGDNDNEQNQDPNEETTTDDDDVVLLDGENELSTGVHPDDNEAKVQPSPATGLPSDALSAPPLINPPAFIGNDTATKRSVTSPAVFATSRLRANNFEYFASPAHQVDATDPSLSTQSLASEIQHDTFMAMTLLQPSLSTRPLEDGSEHPATAELISRVNRSPEVGEAPHESLVDSHLLNAMNDASNDISNGILIHFSLPASDHDTTTAVMSTVATASHRNGRNTLRMQEISSDQNSTSINSMATGGPQRSVPFLPGFQLAVFTFLSAIATARPTANGQAKDESADDRISKRTTSLRHLASIISARFYLFLRHRDSRRHRSH